MGKDIIEHEQNVFGTLQNSVIVRESLKFHNVDLFCFVYDSTMNWKLVTKLNIIYVRFGNLKTIP